MSVDAAFTRKLPKTELHAHLTGSISRDCLHEIWLRRKAEEPDFQLDDPLEALPAGKADYDIDTFFPLFSKYIYHLCSDLPSIEYSTTQVLKDFSNDGVCYLELRTTPRASPTLTKDTYVSRILDVIDDFDWKDMTTYLILSVDRRVTAAEALEVVDLAIKYQRRGVIGLDLCGDPSKAVDVSKFREAFEKAKDCGLKITLHFAEVPSSSSDEELQALLSFQPDRLGHVIHINDAIGEEIKSRKLALELCLSCNVSAKLTKGGFKGHIFGQWIKEQNRGPIVLCTDDVGVFLSPLSNEYLLAAEHFRLSREDLLQLCESTSEAIFAGEAEKTRIRAHVQAMRLEMRAAQSTALDKGA